MSTPRSRPAADEPADPAGDQPERRTPEPPTVERHPVRDFGPFLLVRAAHPRQAVLTAAGVAGAAAAFGRPLREVGLVALTVLVGQVVLGWHNDLVDADVDLAHERAGKPVSDGRLDPGSLWFALSCAVLVLVPLAFANGVTAGACYLGSVVVAALGNVVLRRGPLSFVPWVVAFGLYAPFLSYGGWVPGLDGEPPHPVVVALAALAGVGAHVLTALWGLVADHEDGWTYLPLRLGLRMGATRLLVLTLLYLAVVLGALGWQAARVGLTYDWAG